MSNELRDDNRIKGWLIEPGYSICPYCYKRTFDPSFYCPHCGERVLCGADIGGAFNSMVEGFRAKAKGET
jgi:hypothetical protein